MTSDSQSPGEPPKQINLQQIAQQFMVGLQRHFDMLAYTLASRQAVSEADYKHIARAPQMMPVAARHQNFEQMQAYARDLMLRQVMGDILKLSVAALNNAHFVLALVKATQANTEVSAAAQKAAQQAQKDFVAAPLDEKFNRLEQNYGIMCELEDSVTSIAMGLQALLQHGGQVQAAQLDANGELAVDYKVVSLTKELSEGASPKPQLSEQRKVFREGDTIAFSDTELQLLLVSVASFADALFKSVAAYAKTIQAGN